MKPKQKCAVQTVAIALSVFTLTILVTFIVLLLPTLIFMIYISANNIDIGAGDGELFTTSIIGLFLSPLPILSGLYLTIALPLKFWRKHTTLNKLMCPNCNYNMRGSYTAGRSICPECGCDCGSDTMKNVSLEA
jgi:hypothetical protein